MGNDDFGGQSFKQIGDNPLPGSRIKSVWVCVTTHPDGGEGVYGSTFPGLGFTPFVTSTYSFKETLDRHLRESGALELLRRQGVKLEWRRFGEG